MLRPREFVSSLLLEAAWGEAAHHGGVKPVQMVAQCLANRVRLGWGSWHRVLDTWQQYRASRLPRRMALPEPGDPRFLQLLPSIDAIYDNSFEDLVKAGIFWADAAELADPSDFFREHVLNGSEHNRVAQSASLIIWD